MFPSLKLIPLPFLHYGTQNCNCCCYYDGTVVVPVYNHIDFVVCIDFDLVYTRCSEVCNFVVVGVYNYWLMVCNCPVYNLDYPVCSRLVRHDNLVVYNQRVCWDTPVSLSANRKVLSHNYVGLVYMWVSDNLAELVYSFDCCSDNYFGVCTLVAHIAAAVCMSVYM